MVILFGLFRMNAGPDMAFLIDPNAAERVIKHETLFFWKNLFLWDANWYKQIVLNGYSHESSAFFPLYPLLLSAAYGIFRYLAVASAVVSIAGLAASLYYLARLCEIHAPGKKYTTAILLFLFFPTAFFLLAPYTESIFVPLLLAGAYYIDTKQPWKAVIIGVLLGMTRMPGFLFSILPLYHVLFHVKEKNSKVYLLAAVAPLAGIALYGGYLWYRFGNFFQFLDAQKLWRRNYDPSVLSIVNRYKEEWIDVSSVMSIFHPKVFVFGLDALFFAAAMGIIAYMFFRWKKEYALLCGALLLLPALTGTFSSMPRFVLPVAPFLILFLHRRIQSEEIKVLLVIFSALLWTLFLVMFVNLYWIA